MGQAQAVMVPGTITACACHNIDLNLSLFYTISPFIIVSNTFVPGI